MCTDYGAGVLVELEIGEVPGGVARWWSAHPMCAEPVFSSSTENGEREGGMEGA